MPSIFLSDSRRDGPDAIDLVFDELRRHGYRDIFAFDVPDHGNRVGERWSDELAAQLVACDVLLALTGARRPRSLRSAHARSLWPSNTRYRSSRSC
jgi:hypothetical protein